MWLPDLGLDVLKLPIYLDNHATTRTDPRVVEAMLPYFTERFTATQPASRIALAGRPPRRSSAPASRSPMRSEPSPRRSSSRRGRPSRTTWRSRAWPCAMKRKGNHLVTSATEHKAVLDTMKRLGREGWEVTVVPCDETGRVSAESIAAGSDRADGPGLGHGGQQRGRHAQSDRGEIGRLCHDRGVIFHTDATQAVGKVCPRRAGRQCRSTQSLRAQDLRSQGDRCSVRPPPRPAGAAASSARRRRPRARVAERDVAVPLVVGLGAAAELAVRERPDEARTTPELP